MLKQIFAVVMFMAIAGLSSAQGSEKKDSLSSDSIAMLIDSLESKFKYQSGKVSLDGGIATLNIPPGFKFLDATQSKEVLVDLWGNPSADGTLGMIFQENGTPLQEDAWALIISYDEIGYVKDGDADDINYDDLLKDMQKETAEASVKRKEMGYESVSLVGWAATPYYDKSKKVLHWAKEMKFGENPDNTLNYNIRVLGRKGVLVLNAVAGMNQLPEVKKHIEPLLGMVEFNSGYKYAEFDPKIDQVAAYTIGGLVAGKVLAKVGFFAIILKFGKFILFGLAAFGVGIWRYITGRKNNNKGNLTPNDHV